MPSEPNPYLAPTAVDAAQPSWLLGVARREARFAAALIDSLLFGALLFVAYMIARAVLFAQIETDMTAGQTSEPRALEIQAKMTRIYAFVPVPALLLYAFQCFLIARSGQSIGKRWLGLRIVRQNGEPAGFVRGVLLRA